MVERGIRDCIQYGDSILPVLTKMTANFNSLPPGAEVRIARVLGSMNTPGSLELLRNLYGRSCGMPSPNDYRSVRESACVRARLTGAAGLVLQGLFGDTVDVDCIFVRELDRLLVEPGKPGPGRRIGCSVCALSLGQLAKPEAVPYLVSALEGDESFHFQTSVAHALGLIGSTEAIAPLRDCLLDPTYIPGDAALRALVLIGDDGAIPTAIQSLQDDVRSRRVAAALEQITGRRYGTDRVRWTSWWTEKSKGFEIPVKVLQELRKEAGEFR